MGWKLDTSGALSTNVTDSGHEVRCIKSWVTVDKHANAIFLPESHGSDSCNELVDGKWVSVSGVRATDLDAGKVVSTPKTTPVPAAPKATKTTTPKKTDA